MSDKEKTTAQKPILIDVPMPITTPRLVLRPPMPGDGPALHEAKGESMAELKRWMPWAKDDATADDDEATAREAYARFIRREDIMLLGFERAGGRFVIGTGLHRFDWAARRFEIGYWVRTGETGKGYATESTAALVRYAFAALAARRVEITHAAGNYASAAVIRKLGFVPEGIHRAATTLPDGRSVDSHVYARLDEKGLPDFDLKWGPP